MRVTSDASARYSAGASSRLERTNAWEDHEWSWTKKQWTSSAKSGATDNDGTKKHKKGGVVLYVTAEHRMSYYLCTCMPMMAHIRSTFVVIAGRKRLKFENQVGH